MIEAVDAAVPAPRLTDGVADLLVDGLGPATRGRGTLVRPGVRQQMRLSDVMPVLIT